MKENMFFGKLLREMRLKYGKIGARNFAKKMSMNPSDYIDIEMGYTPPPSQSKWLFKIFENMGFTNKKAIFDNLKAHPYWTPGFMSQKAKDQQDLWYLHNKPFVMQKMNEEGLPAFVSTENGAPLDKDKLRALAEWMQTKAKEHNKKVDAYNKEHGVE